jgi:hypothetical protein
MILPPSPLPATRSARAWELFHRLLPTRLLNDLDPKAPQTVYTPWVVTWLLIYQRLHGNASLNDAVSEFTQRFPQQARPDCRRGRPRALSTNSGAYSRARTQLDSRVLHWAAEHVFTSLIATALPSWDGRRVFILDGSTIQLAPSLGLQVAFPPASNQHGPSHWPILHLAVAHELASGLAVFPEFGPKYGPNAVSELTLSCGLLARLPACSILLADRNFGVFAFAWAAAQAGHDALLRLTESRFRALQKQAQRVGPGKWALTWQPSVWDRKQHPELPAGAQVTGWLYEQRVSERLTLWLFTTREAEGTMLADLYHQRQDVETDIRNLKETLRLGEMTSQSVAMVEKELAAALLTYNLANQVRRLAAARLQVPPRRLSFAGVWSLLQAFMAGLGVEKTEAEAEAAFERLLRGAGQRKLPKRSPGRSYPREVISRRNKFPTRKRHQKPVPK